MQICAASWLNSQMPDLTDASPFMIDSDIFIRRYAPVKLIDNGKLVSLPPGGSSLR